MEVMYFQFFKKGIIEQNLLEAGLNEASSMNSGLFKLDGNLSTKIFHIHKDDARPFSSIRNYRSSD